MHIGLLLLLSHQALGHTKEEPKWPVMFVPGIAGSGIMARYVSEKASPKCASEEAQNHIKSMSSPAGWFRLWLSLSGIMPPRSHQHCWMDTLRLEYTPPHASSHGHGKFLKRYNATSLAAYLGKWDVPAGIETVVDEGVRGVDYLDYIGGYGLSPLRYFHDIISHLETRGYVPGLNLAAYPYDWRFPLWHQNWTDLREAIELLSAGMQHRPVFVIIHSMGMLVMNYFLETQTTADWRRKYIKGIIALNPASGGSFKAVRSFISGYNPVEISLLTYLNIPQLISNTDLREAVQTFGSLISLIPHPYVYPTDQPFISIRQIDGSLEEYSLANWTDLLTPEYRRAVTRGQDYLKNITVSDPGVPVYCFYSLLSGDSTEAGYLYEDGSVDKDPFIFYVPGDGTLPEKSLGTCRTWPSTVLTKYFHDLDHMFLLRDSEVIATITLLLETLL